MSGLARLTSQSDKKPNVLVITVDCLRPDFLGSYNNSNKMVSPTIDSLASSGHLFENAFANASQTAISFPSLFTANYPLSYGGPNYLSPERVFISEWFKNQGYQTAGFSTNHWLSYMSNYPNSYDTYKEYYQFHKKVKEHSRYLIEKGYSDGKSIDELKSELKPVIDEQYQAAIEGSKSYLERVDWESDQVKQAYDALKQERTLLDNGFDIFISEINADLTRPSVGQKIHQEIRDVAASIEPVRQIYKKINNSTSNSKPRDKPMTDAEKISDDVISHLQHTETDDIPLFLWMHYMDAHRPYLPGSSDNWEKEYKQYIDAVGESVSFNEINNQTFAAYEALYKATIRYIDEQIRRVIETAKQLERDTVIVLTADHGEEFREHGDIDHNAKLYDELIHVPLIVSKLGSKTDQTQHRQLISHVDLLPSVYSALIPDASVPKSVEGKDIFKTERTEVISETLRTAQSPEHPHHVGMSLNSDYKRIAARSRSKKVIYYEDTQQWQYYDLETDPLEQHNLASEQKEPRLQEVVKERQNKIESMPSTEHQRSDQPDIVEDRLEDLGYKM